MASPFPEPSAQLLRDPLGMVRRRCAEVARGALRVRIDDEGIARLAASLAGAELRRPQGTPLPGLGLDPEAVAAYVLCLDAINFGSGWFPLLAKLPGQSGFRTVEAHLQRRFRERGAPGCEALLAADGASMAELLEQPPSPAPALRELLELFGRAWRELGALLERRFAGSFLALLDAARGSAADLVRILLEMPLYRDIARYDELEVPFLKRAQISAADLAAALPQRARFADLDQLTLFADNLVPHVLRVDGALVYDATLLARIEREELLQAGSREEVEIRACAVEAVERLCAQLSARGAHVRPLDLDFQLWTRGGQARYKAQPRHRARCAFY
jgi:hypothetical protein